MSDQQFLIVPSSGGKAGGGKKKTPFSFFLQEKRQQWEKEGRWGGGRPQAELVQAVLPLWAEVKKSPRLMEPYIEQHRQWRGHSGDLENRYDTMGRSLGDISREAARQRSLATAMEVEIEETVEGLGVGGAPAATFYVLHCNYLVRTDRGFYPPCEVGVVEWSLEGGVKRCWQEFVSPGDSVPVGYKHKVQQHARVTHYLTPEFEHYVTDYREIMTGLIKFLGGARDGRLPPLYVMAGNQEAAACVTEFLVERSAAVRPLRLLSLPNLCLEVRGLLVFRILNTAP